MSGVRVRSLPEGTVVKDIKIHFSKPENGGGEIQHIYHPLFHGDAVVIFKEEHVADAVLLHHKGNTSRKFRDSKIEALPITQMYTVLTAELTTPITDFLRTTKNVLDEIQFVMELKYEDTRRDVSTLTGNWYQLECAWKLVEDLMQEQSQAHEKFSRKASDNRQEKMEVDELFPSSKDRETSPVMRAPPIISMPSSGLSSSYRSHSPSDYDKQRNRIPESFRHDDHSDRSDGEQSNDSSFTAESERQRTGADKMSVGGGTAGTQRQINMTDDEDEDNDSHETEKGANAAGDDNRNRGATKGSSITEILNDKPDDPRSLDFKHGPVHVSVFTGNITYAETEAIVNASNSNLEHYGGVAYAIQSAADAKLKEECFQYITDNGQLKVADVMHTSAGGKISPKVKYVIHAVGPLMNEWNMEKCIHELTRTFLNTMTYANKHLKIKSITMPLISSGVFGGVLETCVQAFLDAVLIFVRDHCGGELHLQEIHLINNNSDSTVQTVLCVRSCLDKGLDTLADLAVQSFSKMSLEEDVVLRRSGTGRAATGFSSSVRLDKHRSYPSESFSSDLGGTASHQTSLRHYSSLYQDKGDHNSEFSSLPLSLSTANVKKPPIRSLTSDYTGLSTNKPFMGSVSGHSSSSTPVWKHPIRSVASDLPSDGNVSGHLSSATADVKKPPTRSLSYDYTVPSAKSPSAGNVSGHLSSATADVKKPPTRSLSYDYTVPSAKSPSAGNVSGHWSSATADVKKPPTRSLTSDYTVPSAKSQSAGSVSSQSSDRLPRASGRGTPHKLGRPLPDPISKW